MTETATAVTGDAHQPSVMRESSALRCRSVEVDPRSFGSLVEAGGLQDRILWHHKDTELLGCGEALTIDLPAGISDPGATRMLDTAMASIETQDALVLPGSGPVAFGALPYRPDRPARLVVPHLLLGRRSDRAWLSIIEPIDHTKPPMVESELLSEPSSLIARLTSSEEGAATSSPDGFKLSLDVSHIEWKQMVSAALAAIAAGDLTKVVLARRVQIDANRPFVLSEILSRLASLYPTCFVFRCGSFLGASPELLASRFGSSVASHPLAGTVARSGDDAIDAALVKGMMNSSKARHEHQVVVSAIKDALSPACSSLEVPTEPSVLALRNVSHLGTPIRGTLATGRRFPTAFEIVSMLQPTPAVGGIPTPAALEWQEAHEGFDRGHYCGPVGWVDSRGDGEWAVGLRSAEVRGDQAWIYAGNGIVSGSDPEAELAETQLKLQALLSALVRP